MGQKGGGAQRRDVGSCSIQKNQETLSKKIKSKKGKEQRGWRSRDAHLNAACSDLRGEVKIKMFESCSCHQCCKTVEKCASTRILHVVHALL